MDDPLIIISTAREFNWAAPEVIALPTRTPIQKGKRRQGVNPPQGNKLRLRSMIGDRGSEIGDQRLGLVEFIAWKRCCLRRGARGRWRWDRRQKGSGRRPGRRLRERTRIPGGRVIL